MTRQLPLVPNWEHLKRQAKDLLRDYQAQESKSVQRIQLHHPQFASHALSDIFSSTFVLADAQLVIAREYGFASWPKLKRHLELIRQTSQEKSAAFLQAVRARQLTRGQKLLHADPAITHDNIFAAVAVGECDTVKKMLNNEPSLATAYDGLPNWSPLLYLCFTPFFHAYPDRSSQFTEIAQLLVDHGADPNSFYVDDRWPDARFPALYGACGVLNHAEIARVLLDAGANPNDQESLYHACEFSDHACLRLLLERGALPANTNALKRKLDYDDADGVKLLLDYGADPNEYNGQPNTALHHAIIRHCSPTVIELLLLAGAETNLLGERSVSPLQLAVRLGRTDIAALLQQYGAVDNLSLTDAFLNACIQADRTTALRILAENPQVVTSLRTVGHSILAHAVSTHNIAAVRLMLEAGFDSAARIELNATSLHWACWHGQLEIAKLLLAHNADLEADGAELGSTPLQWAVYGFVHNAGADRDHLTTIEHLLSAGASARVAHMIPTGNSEIDALLQKHGANF